MKSVFRVSDTQRACSGGMRRGLLCEYSMFVSQNTRPNQPKGDGTALVEGLTPSGPRVRIVAIVAKKTSLVGENGVHKMGTAVKRRAVKNAPESVPDFEDRSR